MLITGPLVFSQLFDTSHVCQPRDVTAHSGLGFPISISDFLKCPTNSLTCQYDWGNCSGEVPFLLGDSRMCPDGKNQFSTQAYPHLFLLERNNSCFILISTVHVFLAILSNTPSDRFYFTFLCLSSFVMLSDTALMYTPTSYLSSTSLLSTSTTALLRVGDWTWSFTRARQVFCHWAIAPAQHRFFTIQTFLFSYEYFNLVSCYPKDINISIVLILQLKF